IGSSHPVYRISVDGVPRAVVKVFGPPSGDTDGDPACEHGIRALGAQRPEVGALLAPSAPWALHPRVLASAFVSGHPAGHPETGDPDAARRALARLRVSLVPPLARLHRATRDLALHGGEPWTTRPPWV